MSCFSIKGTIYFWLFVIVIVASLLSGDFQLAGDLTLYLIIGMVVYQVFARFLDWASNVEIGKGAKKHTESHVKNSSASRQAAIMNHGSKDSVICDTSCATCGLNIDTNNNFQCPKCGARFWRTKEIFEAHLKNRY